MHSFSREGFLEISAYLNMLKLEIKCFMNPRIGVERKKVTGAEQGTESTRLQCATAPLRGDTPRCLANQVINHDPTVLFPRIHEHRSTARKTVSQYLAVTLPPGRNLGGTWATQQTLPSLESRELTMVSSNCSSYIPLTTEILLS